MDYSWIKVIKKALDTLDGLSSKLTEAAMGKSLSDSEIRMIIGEFDENISRMSRLLTHERNREVLSKYTITPHELYILVSNVKDTDLKSLLRGERKQFKYVADKLSESIKLWRELIILPTEMEDSTSHLTEKYQPKKKEQMPDCKVLLLLGAGSSRPLEIPTMADFWRIVEINSHSQEEKMTLNQLINVSKDEIIHSPPDLERLLMLLDRYDAFFNTLWEDPSFGIEDSMQYRLAMPFQPIFPWSHEKPLERFMRRCGQSSIGISRIRRTINNIMDAYYTKQFDKEKVDSLYTPLFSLLNNHFKDNNINIFTTNYDTAIEQHCRHNGITLIDGFQKKGPSLVWNPSEYFQKLNPSQKTITFFKLHGSLTWRKIGNEIYEFGMSAKSMPGDTSLIYPTETKEYPNEEPFKTAYKFLGHFLDTAEIAIVIGYSFRDRGITYIIDEALSNNPNLKFFIICSENPEEDTIKRFPYGSQVIKHDFKLGENSKYLTGLNELLGV